MYLTEERRLMIMGKPKEPREYDELANVAKEVMDVLRRNDLMLCEAKVVLNMAESTLSFAPLP